MWARQRERDGERDVEAKCRAAVLKVMSVCMVLSGVVVSQTCVGRLRFIQHYNLIIIGVHTLLNLYCGLVGSISQHQFIQFYCLLE